MGRSGAAHFSTALLLILPAPFAPVLIVSDLMSDYDDVWVRGTVPIEIGTPNFNRKDALEKRNFCFRVRHMKEGPIRLFNDSQSVLFSSKMPGFARPQFNPLCTARQIECLVLIQD